ncbi:MAG: flagellar motor switch protein FliG [Halieaceae bacterium]|jgi:flagellar motor switch protein FliG
MAEGTSLTGAQRAAIFLLGVGEQAAAGIMRHMDPKEVQRVGSAMATLSSVSNQQLAEVFQDFHSKADAVNPLSIGASAFAQKVMIEALGEDKARSVLSKVMPEKMGNRGVEALQWMDARSVADLIGAEHPQFIAIVLASLEEEQAASVLAELPAEMRNNVVMRVARLETIEPAALEELDLLLEKQMGRARKLPPRAVKGMSTAAAMLNNVNTEIEASVLGALREEDGELTDKISELMFVFEDLQGLDDRGMQRLIREIAVDNLVIALKGVDMDLQDKFFGNMSSRAADMLREDLEAKGPVKLAEVETAQKEILSVAKQLSDDGEIMIGKGGDDFV